MEARRVPASLIPNVEVQAGPFGTAHSGVRIALPPAGTSRENVTGLARRPRTVEPAPDTIRGLIDAIVLEPEADRLKITLKVLRKNVVRAKRFG
jgi:hypothetical protein